MAAQPQPYITPAEYLAAERAANRDTAGKHEYYQGEVYAMAGASRPHNLLVSLLITTLNNQLGDKCSVYPSDLRLHVADNGLFTYPDISVVCGPEEFLPDAYLDTLLNPTVLLEVLSRSTEQYDRAGKFLLYRELPSLQHYVLVESQRVLVLVYTRTGPTSWTVQEYRGRAAEAPLPAIGAGLPLAELYRKGPLAEL